MSFLLDVRDLATGYGAIEAVRGVSLQVSAGELVTLIGSNGAGKSSTLNTLAGLLPAKRGEIHFDGERIDRLPAHRRVERGLVLVPEGRGIFPQLTVEENLLMGAFHRRDKAVIRTDLGKRYELFPRLAERRKQLAGTLSGGEQQMVAMARALMARPRLLLLDEPSMGLAPLMVQTIFSVIRQVAADGVTLLLVEQNAQAALAIASQAHVMDHGELRLSGPAAQLLHDPQVRETYLGG